LIDPQGFERTLHSSAPFGLEFVDRIECSATTDN
jgi:hypothetical protein